MPDLYTATQMTNAPVSLAILSATLSVLAILAFRTIRRKFMPDGSAGRPARERGPLGRGFRKYRRAVAAGDEAAARKALDRIAASCPYRSGSCGNAPSCDACPCTDPEAGRMARQLAAKLRKP